MSWKLGPVMMSPALLLHTADMDHWELELQTSHREVDVKLGRDESHEGRARAAITYKTEDTMLTNPPVPYDLGISVPIARLLTMVNARLA